MRLTIGTSHDQEIYFLGLGVLHFSALSLGGIFIHFVGEKYTNIGFQLNQPETFQATIDLESQFGINPSISVLHIYHS